MFQFHYDTRSSSVAPVCVHLGTSGLKNNLTSFRNKCAACSVLFLYGHGKRNRDVCGVRDGIAAVLCFQEQVCSLRFMSAM